MKNTIICGDCAKVLTGFPAECIDLTVTSPPYDNLREYNGYVFDFEPIAQQLYRVTKPGGVVVWVVGDETKDFCESLTEARQKIYFVDVCGFNLLDSMIYNKQNYTPAYPTIKRYADVFEYMLVFCKGSPKTFNPIQTKRKEEFVHLGNYLKSNGNFEKGDGFERRKTRKNYKKQTKDATNIWTYSVGGGNRLHPAPFPEALARDHIISWSNLGDIVLDPMCGSGTTLKMAKELGRNYIGIDISQEYCDLSKRRVEGAKVPLFVLPSEPDGKPKAEQLGLKL